MGVQDLKCVNDARKKNLGPIPIIKAANNQQNQSCGFWITFVELGTIGRNNGPKFATVAASVLLGAMDFELNQRKFAVEPPRIDTWKTLRWARWAWPQRVKLVSYGQWDPLVH